MREGGEKSRNGNGDGERREAKRTEEVTLGPAGRRRQIAVDGFSRAMCC